MNDPPININGGKIDEREAKEIAKAVEEILSLRNNLNMGYVKSWKLTKNLILELQISKFPENWYRFISIMIGTHGFEFLLLGISIAGRWRCDHPNIEFEAISPWGHYFGINLFNRRHKDDKANH